MIVNDLHISLQHTYWNELFMLPFNCLCHISFFPLFPVFPILGGGGGGLLTQSGHRENKWHPILAMCSCLRTPWPRLHCATSCHFLRTTETPLTPSNVVWKNEKILGSNEGVIFYCFLSLQNKTKNHIRVKNYIVVPVNKDLTGSEIIGCGRTTYKMCLVQLYP